MWLLMAVLSAFFAGLTSILAKCGIKKTDSDVATVLRTIVLMKGKQRQVRVVDRRELAFISLSGLATGGSWLCYYYAIQNGIVSVVVPIDKLSIAITVLFSWFVFGEKLSKKALAGLCLMVAGTLVMAICA